MIDISIKDFVYVRGLSRDAIEKIEEELTFSNPKYSKIMKYSRYGSTREPKYLCYANTQIVKGVPTLRVPIGYLPNLLLKSDDEVSVSDYRKLRTEDTFPEFTLELRDTQRQAMKAYFEHNSDTLCNSGGIVLPTGKGKTILGIAIASKLKARTLIIVHKDDLVKGWLKSIPMCFNSQVDVGIIKADKRKVGKHFTIATIQTLNRLSKEELDILYKSFGLIIQDEMHHCPSSEFSLANNFLARYRLGLTATPERNDGLAHIMKLYFGEFCYVYESNPDEEEDILPVEVIFREPNIFFNPVCTLNNGRFILPDELTDKKHYDPNYMLKANERRIRTLSLDSRPKLSYATADLCVTNHHNVVDTVCKDVLSEFNKGHSCIVFFKQVESLMNYKEQLINRGVSEDCIGLYYGSSKKCYEAKEQAEKVRKFITLTTFSKATEGTDVQQWEVCFLVSSINNGKDVEQAAGRIRRIKSGGNKLSTVKLYDYDYGSSYPMYNHKHTRYMRYSKLKFKVIKNSKPKLFNRGFSR